MAAPTGPTPDSLARFLRAPDAGGEERYHAFDFFRLVRLFELARPDLPPVGCASLPSQEILRFGQKPYQNFACSSFQDLESPGAGKPPRLSVAFMGLFGPSGALPQCHTEYAMQREASSHRDWGRQWETQRPGLTPSDFKNIEAFARRLRRHDDPVSLAIWNALPVAMRQKLQDVSPAGFLVPVLRDELMDRLTVVMRTTDITPAAREASLPIPDEMERASRDTSVDLFKTNRLLLSAAFPQEVASTSRLMGTAWDLAPWDFADLGAFVRQIRDRNDRFAVVLREHLPARMRQILKDYPPGSFAVEPLMGDLLRTLNDLLGSAHLIQAGACAGMELPVELARLAASQPAGAALTRINRHLLAIAFPEQVHPCRENGGRDETISHFLDLFHNRFISYFYRAWAIHQKAVDAGRPDNLLSHKRHRFPFYLGSLAGFGLESLQRCDALGEFDPLYFSGVLSAQPRNPASFRALIEDYFGIPAQILPFQGRWIELPPGNGCRMGQSRASGLLGANIIAGSKIWDCAMNFRIRMGPMGIEDFARMLPQRQIICARCRRPLEPEHRQKALLDRLPDGVTRILNDLGGCSHCAYTGPEDWDWEFHDSGQPGGRRVVCKKCRAPFEPESFQVELTGLSPDKITERLAGSPGCQSCKTIRNTDWRIVESGSFSRLKAWVKLYFGEEYHWDLQLILRKESVPESVMGQAGRLGQTMWIKTAPLGKDAEEMILQTN